MTPSKKIPFLSYLEPGEYTMLKKYSVQTKTPMTQLMREAVTMRVSSGEQYLNGYNNGITKAIDVLKANQASNMRFPSGRSFGEIIEDDLIKEMLTKVPHEAA
jgi:hypothetical protein